MATRLVISCPNCGAPNAATVAVCVQCGANLKPQATTGDALPNTTVANDVPIDPSSYQSSVQPEVASLERRDKVSMARNFGSQPKVAKEGGIAALGSQAVFYVGCAILIVLPILLIGLGPLRAMLAQIFQH